MSCGCLLLFLSSGGIGVLVVNLVSYRPGAGFEVAGAVLTPLILLGVGWLLWRWETGLRRRPICRTGKCTFDSCRPEFRGRDLWIHCACGDTYRVGKGRIHFVAEDGEETLQRVHHWLKGWIAP